LPLLFAVCFALSADEEIGDAVYRDRAVAAMFVAGLGVRLWRIWRR
jgi:hypothetical protein